MSCALLFQVLPSFLLILTYHLVFPAILRPRVPLPVLETEGQTERKTVQDAIRRCRCVPELCLSWLQVQARVSQGGRLHQKRCHSGAGTASFLARSGCWSGEASAGPQHSGPPAGWLSTGGASTSCQGRMLIPHRPPTTSGQTGANMYLHFAAVLVNAGLSAVLTAVSYLHDTMLHKTKQLLCYAGGW